MPVILAALFALFAIVIGLPGALLAFKKLRKRKTGGNNGKSRISRRKLRNWFNVLGQGV
jgi:hypothetical protein